MYDAAIIGTGPAGISAALNLKLHNKSIIWFGSPDLSKRVELSERIANYPAVPMVSGARLNDMFKKQIDDMGLEITDRTVTSIVPSGDGYMVLGGNEPFAVRSVLLAIGATTAAGYDGESELLGRGVSYCATCDGFLYKGRCIAVYCADKRFEHEVEYLAGMADTVYLSTPYDCGLSLPNVRILPTGIRRIVGDGRVESIELSDGSIMAVDGVFILRNAIAPATLIKGLDVQDDHIVVDRDMRTTRAGIFAAGDCTGRPYQIAKAVGEGNIAAHSMVEYLADNN